MGRWKRLRLLLYWYQVGFEWLFNRGSTRVVIPPQSANLAFRLPVPRPPRRYPVNNKQIRNDLERWDNVSQACRGRHRFITYFHHNITICEQERNGIAAGI